MQKQNNLTADTQNNLTIDDVLKKFKRFRKKDINFFIKHRIISYPLTVNDLYILDLIHRVWRKHELIELMLSGMKKKNIANIVNRALSGCDSKLDMWIYSRVKNKRELGEKIYTKQIVSEAISLFKLKKDKKLIQHIKTQIKKVKERLKTQKRRHKMPEPEIFV